MGFEVLTSQFHPSILLTLPLACKGHLDKVPSQGEVAGMGDGEGHQFAAGAHSELGCRQAEGGRAGVAMSKGTILLCPLALLGHSAAWQQCWAWAGAWDGCWEPGSS